MIRLKVRLLIVSIYQLLPQAYILLLILCSEALGKYNFVLSVRDFYLVYHGYIQFEPENSGK